MTVNELAEMLLKHAEGVALVDVDTAGTIIDGVFDLHAVVEEINGRVPKTGISHGLGANGPEIHRGRRRG
jgi:hypothetical protein